MPGRWCLRDQLWSDDGVVWLFVIVNVRKIVSDGNAGAQHALVSAMPDIVQIESDDVAGCRLAASFGLGVTGPDCRLAASFDPDVPTSSSGGRRGIWWPRRRVRRLRRWLWWQPSWLRRRSPSRGERRLAAGR